MFSYCNRSTPNVQIKDAQNNIDQIRVALNETEAPQSEQSGIQIQNISVISRPTTADDNVSSRSSSPSKEPVYKRLMNHGLSLYVLAKNHTLR